MNNHSQRGYRPAIQSPDIKDIIGDIKTVDGFALEIAGRINRLPQRRVTKSELRDDCGFKKQGIQLLEVLGLLKAESVDGKSRETFDLQEALRVRLRLPALATARGVHLKRKRLPQVLQGVSRLLKRKDGHCLSG